MCDAGAVAQCLLFIGGGCMPPVQ